MSHSESETESPPEARELSDARKQFHDRMRSLQEENANLKESVFRLEGVISDLESTVNFMRTRLARHQSKVEKNTNAAEPSVAPHAALDNHEEAGI